MRQRLHDYIAERPSGVPPDELLGLVFTAQGRDPEFGRRFLDTLLGVDQRLRFDDGAGRWRAVVHDVLAQPLAETTFTVVDVETTGGRPGPGTLTEIGAVRVRGGRLAETFETLVNPGRPIPPFIVGLTGITDTMVATAPRAADAVPHFLDFLGDAVPVAHNAAFDVSHLNAEAEAAARTRLALPAVCTLRLARRLLPGRRRRSLDAVASDLGVGVTLRHRALPDARLAAEILCIFLERLAERGIDRLDQLLDFQQSAADGRPFIVHVPRARVDQAPTTPGVYHLLGADGRLLYVGKAVRLRERLASWFTNSRGHSPRALSLIRQVHDFRVAETGSELAASLLEARHIRELHPPFNRQRKHLPRVGFLKLSARSAFPRLWVTERLSADRATYVGPFRSRDAAERALGVFARRFGLRTCAGSLSPDPAAAPCLSGQVGACTAPCVARIGRDAYRRRAESLLAFLDGDDATVLDEVARHRDALADALRFESAARAQRELETLEGLRRRHQTLGWVVARQNFVVLQPTLGGEGAILYGVLGGRLAIEARITATADLLAAVELIGARFDRYQSTPLGRDEVDGTTIIAAWLRDRGERDGVLLPFDRPEALVDRLDELTVTVRDLGLPGPLPAISWP